MEAVAILRELLVTAGSHGSPPLRHSRLGGIELREGSLA